MKGYSHISRLRSVMTTICIAIFLFCYVNATMFWHGHSFQGGWFFHSHIAGWAHRTAHDSGDHTAAQFQLLAEVNQLACTESAVTSYSLTRPDSVISDRTVSAVSLRGPPELA